MPAGAQLTIEDGAHVTPGTTMAKISREAYKTARHPFTEHAMPPAARESFRGLLDARATGIELDTQRAAADALFGRFLTHWSPYRAVVFTPVGAPRLAGSRVAHPLPGPERPDRSPNPLGNQPGS